jgi:site-specific recombinase XerD
MTYFSIPEVTELLSLPNAKTKKGLRDLAMLTALYETGARVQELIDLTGSSLHIEAVTPYVELRGKGNKLRKVPISDDAADILRKHMRTSNVSETQNLLFTNVQKNKLTRAGVQYVINKYIAQAKQKNPGFFLSKITNHSFRHSKAMHLLEAGVNLVYIRDFLGHSSVTITEIYAKTNPEVKRKALVENSLSGSASKKYDSQNRNDLLEWLRSHL